MSALDGCGIPDLLLFLVLFGQALLSQQLTKEDKMRCNILEANPKFRLSLICIGATSTRTRCNSRRAAGKRWDKARRRNYVLRSQWTDYNNRKVYYYRKASSRAQRPRSKLCPVSCLTSQTKQDYESHIKSVQGVQGVKLWGRKLEEAVAGSHIYVVNSKEDKKLFYAILKAELDTLRYVCWHGAPKALRTKISVSGNGVHVQASTLGSLEAMLEFLNDNGVPIGSFGLGTLQNVRSGGSG